MDRRTPSDLSGTVVVITGASSGIGRATAEAAARRGASVVLAARDPERLEEAAEACRAAGGQALAVPTDVRRRDQVRALAATAIERYGRVDVWVNNASTMAYGRYEDIPDEVVDEVVATNLLGTMYASRAIVDHFIERRAGRLINVVSLYAKMTSPYVSPYVAAKYGVLGFTEVLRAELRRYPDIGVVSILPGSIDTPIFRHAANHSGHPVRPIPPVVDVDRVVAAILRAIDHPRAEVTVGWVGRFLALGHALAPPIYRALVVPVMEQVGFGEGEVAPTDGNVFHPAPPSGQIRDGWRTAAQRRRSLQRVLTLPRRFLGR